jgi:hypothetical protein
MTTQASANAIDAAMTLTMARATSNLTSARRDSFPGVLSFAS